MKIPRHLLPQIPGDKIEDFADFLRGYDVEVTYRWVPLTSLKPIQSEVNRQKVDKLVKDPEARMAPLIISESGYILDGHHRWLAEVEAKERDKMLCLWCGCTIKRLFELAHTFDGSFTKTVHEVRLISFVPNRLLN